MILRGDHVVIDGYTARVLGRLPLRHAADQLRTRGAVRAAQAVEQLADDLDDLDRDSSAAGTVRTRDAALDASSGRGHKRHTDRTADGGVHDLRTGEAADMLGATERWVRRLAARGDLPGADIWMPTPTEQDAVCGEWLAAERQRNEHPRAPGVLVG